jgi:WD40 repeat protein
LSILVLSDSIIVVYADMNVGTYKFSPPSRNVQLPFSFRMDKLRPLARRDLSMSRTAIKRGSAAPASMDLSDSHHAVGNWSFAVTVGGATKEGIRRKAQTLRLTTSLGTSSDGTRDAEANACILSCGYWDHTVKVHSLDGLKLLGSDVGGHQGPIRCLTLGADGALMVTGGQDATCRVWVVDHPDMALALSDGYVQTSLGASYDGESLLTLCHVLWGHLRPISCLGLSADLDVVVSGDLGGQVCVHTIRRGEFIRSITVKANVPGTAAKKIALDSHGSFVVYMEDQGLHVYTINNFHLCSAHADDVLHDMKITSHGEMLVTGGDKGIVVIRTVRDLRVRSTLDISKHGPIRCISLTPDDLNPIPQYLFIGSHDGMITIVSDDPEARVEHEMGVF